MKPIYLDYNATTPVAPMVQEAMLPFITRHFGNPSSTHAIGRAAQEAVEDARSKVAAILGADPDEVVFTSGGTESNNLALLGVLQRRRGADGGHLVISSLEHPAIRAPAAFLERQGFDVTVVPCSSDGLVDPENVARALRPETRLVSIMLANNEVGTLQPIGRIGELCRSRDILMHTDAAQAVGKVRTHVRELNVDLLSIAGHKLYAPKGIGALYVRRGVVIDPILHGADHESGLRPGTENVPFIVGLGKACELAMRGLDEASDRMATLRDRLMERLQEAVGGSLVVHGFQAERLPNTLSIAFPDRRGHDLLERIPELCASTGSACHSETMTISPTLKAMGVPAYLAAGTIRMSLGWYTSEEEVDRAASLLIHAWESPPE